MVPLYAAWIEDLGPGDFVKLDCGASVPAPSLVPAARDDRRPPRTPGKLPTAPPPSRSVRASYTGLSWR
jgi:hypothetical protein